MQNFEFQFPTKLIFGPGSLAKLHKQVKGLGKKALIVIGKGSVKREGTLDEVLRQLREIHVDPVVFEGVEPNPRAATIDRGAALARQEKPRYVIALGGGSVMDAAKCIAMLAVNDGLIWDYAYKGVHQPMQRFQKALPLICIPTVAATSSESDSYAVVTHEATREKCTVFGDAFQPFLSIVDPVLTYSVPPKATVDGAIDIIVHVLEEYLSSREEAPLQDRFSLAIAQTVMDALPRVLKNLRDTEARTQLSWCSTIALSGFLSGREGGWPLHAMEHVLSAHYDISHGSGLAALLIPMMKFDLPVLSQKSNPLSIDGMADWMKSVGANYTLTQLGISNADFPRLADDVIRLNGDSRGILENSIPMGKSEILQVLREAT